MLSEPAAWTQARQVRLQAQWPQMAQSTPDEILAVDGWASRNGQPVTDWTMQVMRTAAFGAQQRKV